MILLIAIGSVTIAFFVTRNLLGDPQDEIVKVQTIEKINSEVQPVDEKIFNKDAINPAVEVQIDGSKQ